MRSSCCCTPAGVWQTGVATSSTDCISSELMRGSSSWPATAARTVSMCWTRSNVSLSRSMYSSSTPSVYGSLAPKAWSSTLPPGGNCEPFPVMEGGISESVMPGRYPPCLQEESGAWRASFGKECVGLDLNLPGWIEQPLDHQHGRRRRMRPEHLTVCHTDRLPVGGVDEVDASTNDMLGRCADFVKCIDDDRQAAPRLLVRVSGLDTDRGGSGDVDVATVAHRPGVPDRVREGRDRGNRYARHVPSIPRCGRATSDRRLGRWRRRGGRRAGGRRRCDAWGERRGASVGVRDEAADRGRNARRAGGGDGRPRRAGRPARLDAPSPALSRVGAAA